MQYMQYLQYLSIFLIIVGGLLVLIGMLTPKKRDTTANQPLITAAPEPAKKAAPVYYEPDNTKNINNIIEIRPAEETPRVKYIEPDNSKEINNVIKIKLAGLEANNIKSNEPDDSKKINNIIEIKPAELRTNNISYRQPDNSKEINNTIEIKLPESEASKMRSNEPDNSKEINNTIAIKLPEFDANKISDSSKKINNTIEIKLPELDANKIKSGESDDSKIINNIIEIKPSESNNHDLFLDKSTVTVNYNPNVYDASQVAIPVSKEELHDDSQKLEEEIPKKEETVIPAPEDKLHDDSQNLDDEVTKKEELVLSENVVLYDDASGLVDYFTATSELDYHFSRYKRVKRLAEGCAVIEGNGISLRSPQGFYRFNFNVFEKVAFGKNYAAIFISSSESIKLLLFGQDTDAVPLFEKSYGSYLTEHSK